MPEVDNNRTPSIRSSRCLSLSDQPRPPSPTSRLVTPDIPSPTSLHCRGTPGSSCSPLMFSRPGLLRLTFMIDHLHGFSFHAPSSSVPLFCFTVFIWRNSKPGELHLRAYSELAPMQLTTSGGRHTIFLAGRTIVHDREPRVGLLCCLAVVDPFTLPPSEMNISYRLSLQTSPTTSPSLRPANDLASFCSEQRQP